MIKLAMIDGTGAYHARAFAGLINRVDEDAFRASNWPLFKSVLSTRATVTHIWGDEEEPTRSLARAAGIKNVVSEPADVIGEVDGVLLLDNLKMTHQRHAPTFIKAGVPAFIDKPLSPRWAQAQRIVQLARKSRTPIMSTSALRYATEIADRKAILDQVGDIVTCSAAGTNELFFYGIHALTFMLTVMQGRVRSVLNVGRRGQNIVRVRLVDGRQGVLLVSEKGVAPTFEVTIHGSKGHLRIASRDAQGFYGNMLADFLNVVETRKPSVPYDETLNVIHALLLAKKSLRDGREYKV